MLMAVLDATADGLLCRPHSPSGRKVTTNMSDALELFVDDADASAEEDRPRSPLLRLGSQSSLGDGRDDRRGQPEARPVSAWKVHATARAVGVKALQSLAARHTQTVAEKEECEAIALQALSHQEQLATAVAKLEEQRATLTAHLRAAHSKLREAAQREKDKEREHARAMDLMVSSKSMEARALMVDID